MSSFSQLQFIGRPSLSLSFFFRISLFFFLFFIIILEEEEESKN